MNCYVPVEALKQFPNMIIYNLVFSKKDKTFTEKSIYEESHNLDSNITYEQVIEQFNHYVKVGLINQHVSNYSINHKFRF